MNTTPLPRPDGPRAYAFGPFLLQVGERRLLRDGEEVALTRKAFDTLLVLVETAGRLQSREALIRILWPDTIVEEHGLTWYLSVLRKTLGDTGKTACYIETIRGHGYRFIAPVQPMGATDERVASTGVADGDGAAIPAQVIVAPAPAIAPASAPSRRRHRLLPALALACVLAVALAAGIWLLREAPVPVAAIPAHSVAVLPFENLGPDRDSAYFVSGIQNVIATKLASVADLRVVARGSTADLGSRPSDLDRIVAHLGVANVLEGSVQKAGANVLVSVQLVEGHSGKTLWAQTYTRTLDDVFAIEREIAEQVASSLQANLLPAEARLIAAAPTHDAEAYNLYLQAEYRAWQIETWGTSHSREALDAAASLFEQAIARDARFALAFARLSFLQSYAYWAGIDHAASRIGAATVAAERALALAPDLPQAHLAMGYVHYYGRRDYAAALDEFEQAQRGLPNNADVVAAIALLKRRQGRWQEAIEGLTRAADLDRRNPDWPNLKADTLVMLRDYDQAGMIYDRAQAMDPRNGYATVNRTAMLLFAGQPDRAALELEKIPPSAGPAGVTASMRYQIARLRHRPDEALAVLADAPDWVDDPWMLGLAPTSLLRAVAHEEHGEAAQALQNYRQAHAMLQRVRDEEPDNPIWLALLGLAEAGLGNRAAALDAVHRANRLVPVEKDAYDGPYYLAMLAQVQVRVGDAEAASATLRRALALPSGLTLSDELVRIDPRFRALPDQLAAR